MGTHQLINRAVCMFCSDVLVLNPFVGRWQPALRPDKLYCEQSSPDYDWCHAPMVEWSEEDKEKAVQGLVQGLLDVLKELAA